MKALSIAVALLAGCAQSDDFIETEWTWEFSDDPGCLQPTAEEVDAVRAGADLWSVWDVNLIEGDGGNHAEVCFVDYKPRGGHLGVATRQARNAARILIKSDIEAPHLIAIAAHEFGHLVIGQHKLHMTDRGITGVDAQCYPRRRGGLGPAYPADPIYPACAWTDADIAHLASFGLELVTR